MLMQHSIIELLLDPGADPFIKNSRGKTDFDNVQDEPEIEKISKDHTTKIQKERRATLACKRRNALMYTIKAIPQDPTTIR